MDNNIIGYLVIIISLIIYNIVELIDNKNLRKIIKEQDDLIKRQLIVIKKQQLIINLQEQNNGNKGTN